MPGQVTMHALSNEDLWGLVFEAAGAATGPLLKDNPEYVFPSERVSAAVRRVLAEHGYDEPPVGYQAGGIKEPGT